MDVNDTKTETKTTIPAKNVPVVDDLDKATTDWYLQGQFWLLTAILFILIVIAVYRKNRKNVVQMGKKTAPHPGLEPGIF